MVFLVEMNNAAKPSLLDSLRAQAAARRAQDAESRRPLERTRHEIDGCLWSVFRWFDEAMGHLEVIRPAVSRQFKLGDVLTMDSPQIDRAFVSFRRRGLGMHDALDLVEVFYRMSVSRPFQLRVHPSAAGVVADRLRGASMKFRHDTLMDGAGIVTHAMFHVEPTMRASVSFEPNYDRGVIEVTLTNVDRFEAVRLIFTAEQLDTQALEDLVRLMLGETNTFLHRAPVAMTKRQRDETAETQRPADW